MSPKKQRVYLTTDMKAKIAREYQHAPRADRKAVAAKYNISCHAVTAWIRSGISGGVAATEKPAGPRPLEELLWAVVIKAQADGEITVAEARQLLELVR